MLDDDDRIAFVHQPVEHAQQHFDVVKVQSGGWFVEDVQCAPGGDFRQLRRQFHALGLATRQGRCLLAEVDVSQANVVQGLQLAPDRRDAAEKLQCLLHCHIQHIGDGFAFVFDVKGFAVVALALAHLAGHVHIRQKVHLDFDNAITLAGFTTATLDVETEASRLVSADFRFRELGEEIADMGEHTGVGRRVGTRRAPDRRLVDVDHLVEMADAGDFFVWQGIAF